MAGRLLYLTHPEVAIDPAVPVPDWGLSARGRARAEGFATAITGLRLERLIASRERKAIETAAILGAAIGMVLEIRDDLHENDRSATGFLPPPDFEAMANRFFAEPERSAEGWERAVDAQRRIVDAVQAIVAERRETATLFVGHGGVGTLLRCACAGLMIDRRHDQPGGGGNWYEFGLGDDAFATAWRRMEEPPAGADRAGPA